MKFLSFDSPIMDLIGKTCDMIALNLLWLVCSIPIVTIGAATAAKYTVSMRMIRGEEPNVFVPFFKAFKENMKQATIIWMLQLVFYVLIVVDWLWIYNKGFGNVSIYYLLAVGVISILMVCISMTAFAFVARFEVDTKQAIIAAVVFALGHLVKQGLVAVLFIGTFAAAIWYFKWFPLILLFGTTTAFYFNTILLVKEFKKTEEHYLGETENTDAEDEEE